MNAETITLMIVKADVPTLDRLARDGHLEPPPLAVPVPVLDLRAWLAYLGHPEGSAIVRRFA